MSPLTRGEWEMNLHNAQWCKKTWVRCHNLFCWQTTVLSSRDDYCNSKCTGPVWASLGQNGKYCGEILCNCAWKVNCILYTRINTEEYNVIPVQWKGKAVGCCTCIRPLVSVECDWGRGNSRDKLKSEAKTSSLMMQNFWKASTIC